MKYFDTGPEKSIISDQIFNYTTDILKELRDKKILMGEGAGILRASTEKAKANDPKKRLDKYSAAHYTTGRSGMAFTSTCMMPITESEDALKEDRSVVYQFVKKKAYIRITTSKGELNLELHSDYVAKTCENFVKHCQSGYYNGTIFHRNIRSFIIQVNLLGLEILVTTGNNRFKLKTSLSCFF